jgi:hypothetical protein
VQASGAAVYTYTVPRRRATPFRVARAYAIGMIELDEGVRMLAGIVDSDLRWPSARRYRCASSRISDNRLPMFARRTAASDRPPYD